MKNKAVISIAILVLIIGISGCTDNNQNASNTKYQISNQSANNTQNSTSVAISAAEAKKKAEKYIEEPGATAGEPKLINIDGKSTYLVPVILKGNQVGEILIDAQTGENKGGAGGVSNSTK